MVPGHGMTSQNAVISSKARNPFLTVVKISPLPALRRDSSKWQTHSCHFESRFIGWEIFWNMMEQDFSSSAKAESSKWQDTALLLTSKRLVRPWIRFCWLFTTLQELLSVGRITQKPGLAPVPSSKSTHVTVLIIRSASHGSWLRNDTYSPS